MVAKAQKKLTKKQQIEAAARHRQKILVLSLLVLMLYTFLFVVFNVTNQIGLMFQPAYVIALIPLALGSVGIAHGIVPVIQKQEKERRIVLGLTALFVFVIASLLFFIIDLNMEVIRL